MVGTTDNTAVPEEEITEQQLKEEPELEITERGFPLERYKPLELIGSGGAGTVYLCRDRLLHKKVAVKILRSTDEEQIMIFQNEAKTTARLTHPNIVKVLDFGVASENHPYMVMEYIKGTTLKNVIETTGPIDPHLALSALKRITDALAYAHERRIYHRDLQSANIVVQFIDDERFEVYVIDFGLAKFKEANSNVVDGKTLVGTPFYMSPDVVQGRGFDQRSEVYSVGCILFEALTGSLPFVGETALETISMHANQPVPSVHDYLPSGPLTDDLDAMILRCLEKDPESRFQSMQELSEKLSTLISPESPAVRETAPQAEAGKPSPVTIAAVTVLGIIAVAVLAIQITGAMGSDGALPAAKKRQSQQKQTVSGSSRKKTNKRIVTKESPSSAQDAPSDNSKVSELEFRGSNKDAYTAETSIIIEGDRLYLTQSCSDSDIKDVSDLNHMRVIMAADCTELSPNSLMSLAKAENLRYLGLRWLCMSKEETLQFFKKVKNLVYLNVPRASFIDDDVVEIIVKNNPKIKYLDLTGCTITAASLRSLSGLSELHSLGLKETHLKDTDLMFIPLSVEVVALEDRRFEKAKVAAALKRLKNLKTIHVAFDIPHHIKDESKYAELRNQFPALKIYRPDKRQY